MELGRLCEDCGSDILDSGQMLKLRWFGNVRFLCYDCAKGYDPMRWELEMDWGYEDGSLEDLEPSRLEDWLEDWR